MSRLTPIACGAFFLAWSVLAGCSKPATTTPAADSTTTDSATQDESSTDTKTAESTDADESASTNDAETASTEKDTASMEKDTASTEEDTAQLPTEETTTEAEPAPTEEVLLGTADLTEGIPGSGDLTIEEIQAWLDDPKNHVVLKPTLPKGLALGAGQMAGIEETPLTRAKIELGRQLYFDPRLSTDDTISCASCHNPDDAYARHTQFGVGVDGQTGNRNSPVAYNRILSSLQFWDGRAPSLEEQAKGPIANPIEMSNTHDVCVADLGGIEGYRIQFEKIFPDGVNIENVAKAVASFERALVTGPSPYDYNEELLGFEEIYRADLEDLKLLEEEDPDLFAEYQALKKAADEHPMSDSAKRGRDLFFSERVGCSACHVGANLTDEKYHNLGVGMDAEEPDLGRYVVTKEEKDKGAFKTPTVRNVELTAPYMHDGSQKTLEEVVEWYNKGGHKNPWLDEKIRPLNLNDQEKADLVAFLKATTGPLPKVEHDRLPK